MLTKTEFKEAFREAMEIQLASDLKESEPHEFTPGFEARMEELFKTGEIKKKRTGMKRGVRILLIAAAIALVLATVACAVPEIRESIAGFFVKIFSDHVEYSGPNVTKERIEEEYGLVPIPEGFELVQKANYGILMETIYSDSEGNVIILRQSAGQANEDSIDNEHGESFLRMLGDNNVLIHYSEVGARATWTENGYYFSIDYASNIELSEFENLICSVKCK